MYSDTQQNIRCIENLQRIGRIKSKLPPLSGGLGFLTEPSENWYTNETAEVWDLCQHALHIVDFMATNELTEERRLEICLLFPLLCQHVVWIMECRIQRAPYDDIQAKTALLEKYYDWRKKVDDAFHRFSKDYDRTEAFKVFPDLSGEQEKLYAMWGLLMACKFNVVAKIEVPEADVTSEKELHAPATERASGDDEKTRKVGKMTSKPLPIVMSEQHKALGKTLKNVAMQVDSIIISKNAKGLFQKHIDSVFREADKYRKYINAEYAKACKNGLIEKPPKDTDTWWHVKPTKEYFIPESGWLAAWLSDGDHGECCERQKAVEAHLDERNKLDEDSDEYAEVEAEFKHSIIKDIEEFLIHEDENGEWTVSFYMTRPPELDPLDYVFSMARGEPGEQHENLTILDYQYFILACIHDCQCYAAGQPPVYFDPRSVAACQEHEIVGFKDRICAKVSSILDDLPYHNLATHILKRTVQTVQRTIVLAMQVVQADGTKNEQAETSENTYPASLRDLLPDIPEEDRRLFLDIGVDIKKHFAEYCDAGKWLDDYYDESRYWERRDSRLERLRGLEVEGKALTPSQEREKEGLERLIEGKHPPTLDPRLQDAWCALFKRYRGLLGQEDAKAVLLIAWLATDVDADRADLNLTQFEKWPWDCSKEPIADDGYMQVGRSCLMELLWGEEEGYRPGGKYEVECLKLVHAAWARREAEKHLTGKPTEMKTKRTIWEDISPKMKTAIHDYWKESKERRSEGKRLMIKEFCQKRGLDEETFKSEKDKVEKRKSRPGWADH